MVEVAIEAGIRLVSQNCEHQWQGAKSGRGLPHSKTLCVLWGVGGCARVRDTLTLNHALRILQKETKVTERWGWHRWSRVSASGHCFVTCLG